MKDKIPEISREKQKLLFRIKRMRGQIDAVERSVASVTERCADILMLPAAIRAPTA
jgi:FrmR/RcnR family transcriptional regulator, repressor of rcnA expression